VVLAAADRLKEGSDLRRLMEVLADLEGRSKTPLLK
jgi:hypothetical protein